MKDVKKVHIHYVGFDKSRGVKSFVPSVQGDTQRLKQDIGNVLVTIRNHAEYYYVTIEKDGPDGKPRFATITKKIFFN